MLGLEGTLRMSTPLNFQGEAEALGLTAACAWDTLRSWVSWESHHQHPQRCHSRCPCTVRPRHTWSPGSAAQRQGPQRSCTWKRPERGWRAPRERKDAFQASYQVPGREEACFLLGSPQHPEHSRMAMKVCGEEMASGMQGQQTIEWPPQHGRRVNPRAGEGRGQGGRGAAAVLGWELNAALLPL